jgi:hypothetical protein
MTKRGLNMHYSPNSLTGLDTIFAIEYNEFYKVTYLQEAI